MSNRKSWDQYFLELAEVVATRSTCNRLQVGTVLVNNKQIIATGYNGSPPGHDHCTDVGCLLNEQGRCIRCNHSEQSSILFADRDKLVGATAYVTHEPCENCTRLMVQAGITKIVFIHAYPNAYNHHFLQGVEVKHYPKDTFLL